MPRPHKVYSKLSKTINYSKMNRSVAVHSSFKKVFGMFAVCPSFLTLLWQRQILCRFGQNILEEVPKEGCFGQPEWDTSSKKIILRCSGFCFYIPGRKQTFLT